MQINIKFLQVGIISFLIEMARHIQSTQNKKLVILVQYIKKKVSQFLLYSIAMQNIQVFYRGPAMFVFTCFVWL